MQTNKIYMKLIDIEKSNGIALITGASSGIGEAFAIELAAMKHDITLVARQQNKLEKLAKDLMEKYDINVNIIIADLSTEQGIESIEEYIKILQI